jgi:hypothetical protein
MAVIGGREFRWNVSGWPTGAPRYRIGVWVAGLRGPPAIVGRVPRS